MAHWSIDFIDPCPAVYRIGYKIAPSTNTLSSGILLKTKEVGVKKKFANVAKCAIFIFFMTFYGFSAGEGFDRDANAFSFFCLSIVVIIVWVELKQTLFHVLGK